MSFSLHLPSRRLQVFFSAMADKDHVRHWEVPLTDHPVTIHVGHKSTTAGVMSPGTYNKKDVVGEHNAVPKAKPASSVSNNSRNSNIITEVGTYNFREQDAALAKKAKEEVALGTLPRAAAAKSNPPSRGQESKPVSRQKPAPEPEPEPEPEESSEIESSSLRSSDESDSSESSEISSTTEDEEEEDSERTNTTLLLKRGAQSDDISADQDQVVEFELRDEKINRNVKELKVGDRVEVNDEGVKLFFKMDLQSQDLDLSLSSPHDFGEILKIVGPVGKFFVFDL